MINAPHDAAVLDGFPVVGELAPIGLRSSVVSRLQAAKPHPMIVHFSEVFPITAAFFLLLYLLDGPTIFEVFSAYLIVLGFISSIGCMVTGFFSWTTTYEKSLTRTFSMKILFSSILFAMMIVVFALGELHFTFSSEPRDLSIFHVSLIFGLVPVTIVLGHFGGKIVYG